MAIRRLNLISSGKSSPPTNRSSAQIDNDGGGPHDPDMEARIKKLEEDLNAVKTDLAVIKSNYSTKADVSEAKNSIIMWVVSAIFLAQLLPALLKKLGM